MQHNVAYKKGESSVLNMLLTVKVSSIFKTLDLPFLINKHRPTKTFNLLFLNSLLKFIVAFSFGKLNVKN